MQIHSITCHFTESAGHETGRVTLLYCGFVCVWMFLLAFPATSESVWSLHLCCDISWVSPAHPQLSSHMHTSEKSFHPSLDLSVSHNQSLAVSHPLSLSVCVSHPISHSLSHNLSPSLSLFIYIHLCLSPSHCTWLIPVYSAARYGELVLACLVGVKHRVTRITTAQTHKALHYVLQCTESDGFNLHPARCNIRKFSQTIWPEACLAKLFISSIQQLWRLFSRKNGQQLANIVCCRNSCSACPMNEWFCAGTHSVFYRIKDTLCDWLKASLECRNPYFHSDEV